MDKIPALELLQNSLRDLCDVFNQKAFQPILEADVAAYLYHRLLIYGCPLSNLYSETRVCGVAGQMRKFDLVIGRLDVAHVCIQPLLIVQIKHFPRWGFTQAQYKRRFFRIISKDIESLRQAANVLPFGQIEIVADFVYKLLLTGYLDGKWNNRRRLDVLIDLCRESGITLLWVHPNHEDKLGVEQVV